MPTYVLEGTQDRNIRGITGPRALADILGRFAYDGTYREFGDRAHEGFSELYPDVLRWLAVRPRDAYPRELLRVPHTGIMPLSRRVFWVESDTRQGVVRARVQGDNRIDIESRWARAVDLYLNDRIVDLDRPVLITVNGEPLPPYQAQRSIGYAIEQTRELGDTGRVATDVVSVSVPAGPGRAPPPEPCGTTWPRPALRASSRSGSSMPSMPWRSAFRQSVSRVTKWSSTTKSRQP